MHEYRVKYRNDHGEICCYDVVHNKKIAKEKAKHLIEEEVWIDVYEKRRVKRIKV